MRENARVLCTLEAILIDCTAKVENAFVTDESQSRFSATTVSYFSNQLCKEGCNSTRLIFRAFQHGLWDRSAILVLDFPRYEANLRAPGNAQKRHSLFLHLKHFCALFVQSQLNRASRAGVELPFQTKRLWSVSRESASWCCQHGHLKLNHQDSFYGLARELISPFLTSS